MSIYIKSNSQFNHPTTKTSYQIKLRKIHNLIKFLPFLLKFCSQISLEQNITQDKKVLHKHYYANQEEEKL